MSRAAVVVVSLSLISAFGLYAILPGEKSQFQTDMDRMDKYSASLTREQRDAGDQHKAAEAAAQSKADRLVTAKHACRQFVEATLHDPRSAEWGRYRDFSAIEHKDGAFHVQVHLRGKNAFNATRLATFNCVLRAKGDRWFPISIKQQGLN